MSRGAIFLVQPAATGSERGSAMGRVSQPGFKWDFSKLHRYCRVRFHSPLCSNEHVGLT